MTISDGLIYFGVVCFLLGIFIIVADHKQQKKALGDKKLVERIEMAGRPRGTGPSSLRSCGAAHDSQLHNRAKRLPVPSGSRDAGGRCLYLQ